MKTIKIGNSKYPESEISITFEDGNEYNELKKLRDKISLLRFESKITNRQGVGLMVEACQKMNISYADFCKSENKLC